MSDSIKRQAAIDTVHRMREILDTDNIDDYEELLAEALAQLTPQLKDPDSTDFSDGFAMGYKVGRDNALQEKQWIPCSERLPDELEEVNITWINTKPAPYYESIKRKPNTGSAVYYKGRWYWYSAVCADYLAEYGFSPNDDMDDAIKVIAWAPLPEPYKGQEMEK